MIKPKWRYHVAYQCFNGGVIETGDALLRTTRPIDGAVLRNIRDTIARDRGLAGQLVLTSVTPIGEPRGALRARGRNPR